MTKRKKGPPATVINGAYHPNITIRLSVPQRLDFNLISFPAGSSEFPSDGLGIDHLDEFPVWLGPVRFKLYPDQVPCFFFIHFLDQPVRSDTHSPGFRLSVLSLTNYGCAATAQMHKCRGPTSGCYI